MIILKAARSHRTLAALIAASCLVLAAGCGSDDKNDDQGDTDEDVSGLQPDEGDDGVPSPPPAEQNNDPVMLPPAVVPAGPAPNGVELPRDFLDWRVLGVVAPGGDNPTIRVILGNDIAIEAARGGDTNPWPEGTMIGHIQWKQGDNPDIEDNIAPGDFAAITLMQKNSTRYAADGGWAYGVWAGPELTPPAAQDFDRVCVNCHTDLVAERDYVFTVPGPLPTQEAVAKARTAPNGLKLPANVLDWRVIGVAQPGGTGDGSSIRVIVGNDTAVAAARAGETNPWPENSAISHYVWTLGSNPDIDDALVPGDFGAITFMVRNEDAFAADGDWAFSVWSGADLAAPTDVGFDRACVDCHEASVSDNDRVFTRPGELPEFLLEQR
jgi:hypothetical protein